MARKPKTRPQPEESDMDLDLKILDDIRATHREIDDLNREIERLASTMKAHKAELDSAWDQLRSLTEALTEEHPLFPSRRPAAVTEGTVDAINAAAVADAAAEVATEPEPEAPDPSAVFARRVELFGTDLWQDVGLDVLNRYGLPKTILKKLAESNKLTIEDLKKLGDAGLSLTDVKGIGEAAENKIHAAMAAFWEEWGRDPEPPVAEEAPESPVDEPPTVDGESIDPAPEDRTTGQLDAPGEPEAADEPAEPENESQETPEGDDYADLDGESESEEG